MNQSAVRVVAAFTWLVVGACSVSEPEGIERDGDLVRGTGTVQWYGFEGGFYAILGDDSITYDPINLPDEFADHGLKVWFEGRIRDDLGSVHMVGPIVELKEIRRR